MPYSYGLSIFLSVLCVGLIAILYVVLLRLIKKQYIYQKNYRIMSLYMIVMLLTASIIVLVLYIWNIDIVSFYIDDWMLFKTSVLGSVNKLLTTGIIILSGFGLIKIVSIGFSYSQKKSIRNNKKRHQTILKISQSMTDYAIKIVLLLILLAVWGVNVIPALAGLGIIGLVVGFGAQDLMKDIIAGFFIVFEKHFDIGDIVEINGFKGEVIDIGLKTTKVMNWKKDVKLFNNSSVQNAINYSFTESVAIVEIGIPYDENIEHVVNVLNNELAQIKDTIEHMIEVPQCVGAISFGDSAIILRVMAKTNTEKHYAVERALRNEIKKIFDREKIEIPFTQIVIHNQVEEV